MDWQIVNGQCCSRHCWSVYGEQSSVNSVRADDLIVKLAIINGVGVYVAAIAFTICTAYGLDLRRI